MRGFLCRDQCQFTRLLIEQCKSLVTDKDVSDVISGGDDRVLLRTSEDDLSSRIGVNKVLSAHLGLIGDQTDRPIILIGVEFRVTVISDDDVITSLSKDRGRFGTWGGGSFIVDEVAVTSTEDAIRTSISSDHVTRAIMRRLCFSKFDTVGA